MPATIHLPLDDSTPGERYETRTASQNIHGLLGVRPEATGNVGGPHLVALRHQWATHLIEREARKKGPPSPDRETQLALVKMNGFAAAAHFAFDRHFPLALSPDDVWLAITQGFAAHVNVHAKALRSRFVRHRGQATLEVRRNDFRKGAADNDWPAVFASFSGQIAKHVGEDQCRLMTCDFSTTGPIERAASEIVLMDAMKSYFKYTVASACGIPEITLLGTTADWQNVRDRVQRLAEYDCQTWIAALTPVLDQFVAASKGEHDVSFWRSFYKLNQSSGGPFVNGWINVFFPYYRNWQTGVVDVPNQMALDWASSPDRTPGPTLDTFPIGLARVPFVWNYLKQEFPMEFVGGFVGASQDPETGLIRPAIGWGVADRVKDISVVGEPWQPPRAKARLSPFERLRQLWRG